MPQDRHYLLCRTCSYPIALEGNPHGRFQCKRCGHQNFYLAPRSAHVTLALSLTALLFYFPANIFPFMTIEMYGSRRSSTIWGGIVELFQAGSWPIALLVFFASIFIPLVKLLILFYLSLTARTKKHPRFKTQLYLFVEAIGRWSMLDLFVISLMMSLINRDQLLAFTMGPAAFYFGSAVILTILAVEWLDSRLLWDAHESGNARFAD